MSAPRTCSRLGSRGIARAVGALTLLMGSLTVLGTGGSAFAAPPPTCGPAVGVGASFVVTCKSIDAEQAFTVPARVYSLHIVAVGGTGFGGGPAAVTAADIPVVPGETLYVEVAGNGGTVFGVPNVPGSLPGFNGGGRGGGGGVTGGPGGGGGGASDVRTCTTMPSMANSCDPSTLGTTSDPRLIVAGGSGGGGNQGAAGGAGGTPIGGAGGGFVGNDGRGGGGGTLTAGGTGGTVGPPPFTTPVSRAPSGGAGVGGDGGPGGGGGGGFFGGGGGGRGDGRLIGGGAVSGGGGGGSSFAEPSATGVSFAADTSGMPSITITYTPNGHMTLSKTASPTSGAAPLTVTYTYEVNNYDSDTLYHVAVSDDSCSPVTYEFGDLGHNQLLATDETFVFACTRTYTTPGIYTNHATATAGDAQTGLVVTSNTASATVTVGSAPAGGAHLTLSKSAAPTSGAAPLAVAYTYTLTNDGSDTLYHAGVSDDSCSPVTYQSGDLNHDQLLQPGETFVFTCTHTYTAPGTFTNHATASAGDTQTGFGVSSNTASATVTVGSGSPSAVPLSLAKSATPSSGTAPLAVTYTYTLANTGNDVLFHASVADDSCAPVAYQSGDTNHDQLLQPGETWVFTCSHTYTANGTFTNHATASATDAQTGLGVSSNMASATVNVGPGT